MPEVKTIIITREELTSRRVDNRIREQQAISRNRLYASLQEDSLPVASRVRVGWWQNSAVIMTGFGLLGGLLAWCAGLTLSAILAHGGARSIGYWPDARAQAATLLQDLRNVDIARDLGRYSPEQAQFAADQIRRSGRNNPYFAIATDERFSDAQREVRQQQQLERDRSIAFVIDLLGYGVCGMMIALSLAIAEPLSQRKLRPSLISGAIGATLGLIGGLAAALLAGHISEWAGEAFARRSVSVQNLAAQAAVWGALGLFLGLASGLVMRNWKKLLIGLAGGLLGGTVGGALIHPMETLTHNPQIARLVALLAIGVVAGAGTGLIENAAKAGWLKVTTGIIAGKQFILYRNPTYIGSSPDCQIYLFKDPKVGKRHAAIHITPAGLELEDLPLGAQTFVNGEPITRAPLKNGDRIAIGATQFLFQEKRPSAAR